MEILAIIKEMCRSRGITLTELEGACGLGKKTISNWDKSAPGVDKLMKIADYFGVSVDYLLGREAAGQDPDRPDSYDEIRAELDALRRNPELRVLLSASADLTQEDIAFVTAMAKRMKGEE